MIVLERGAVAWLAKEGSVDVWTPKRTTMACERCGGRVSRKRDPKQDGKKRLPPRCELCHKWTEGEPTIPVPALNVIHVVRTRADREDVTRAKATVVRSTILQDLRYPDALSAGFKTRAAFFDWFRLKYGTGPLVSAPVECWATTYEHIVVNIPQYPAHGESATSTARRSVDYEWREDHKGKQVKVSIELADDKLMNDWALRADEQRQAQVAQRKAAWKAKWRARRDAA